MKLTMIKVKHYQLKNNLINYNILKRYHKWSYKISYVEISITIAINLIFSKDNEEERVMHAKGINKEFVTDDNADEVTKEIFESRYNRYKIGLEAWMTGIDFIFDCAYLLHYKCQKTNPNWGG